MRAVGEAEVDAAADAQPERERGTAVAGSELPGGQGEEAGHPAGMPVRARPDRVIAARVVHACPVRQPY